MNQTFYHNIQQRKTDTRYCLIALRLKLSSSTVAWPKCVGGILHIIWMEGVNNIFLLLRHLLKEGFGGRGRA